MTRYITDPSTPAPAPVLPRALLDAAPERNVGVPQLPYELPAVPDRLLIATLIAHGQPRWAAEEVRRHPGVRFTAFKFYCDVYDAAHGDQAAAERVDYCREAWEKLRTQGLLSDHPTHVEGI